MYVYLQPFYSKGLIEDANDRLKQRIDTLGVGDHLTLRLRYSVAALTGLSQTIYYFALWTITSLTSFLLVGLSSRLNACEDYVGGLTIASGIATATALGSICYLPFATILTQRIIKSVDAKFKEKVDAFEPNLVNQAALLRSQRKTLAAVEGASHPERYFDPAVKRMIDERRCFVSQIRRSYPKDINSRGLAYAEASQRMRKMAAAHTNELQNEPFSRREIDKHLARKITLMAEDGVADLYNYCLEVWASRVRKWSEKFDREAFCRHCVKLFQSLKITKRIERLVRDVKEAENKDKAFKDSEQALRREISDMKGRVFNLDCPWIWTRMWRNIFPYVSSFGVCQEIDRIVDPDIAHFAKVQ